MTRQQFKNYNQAAQKGTMPDSENPAFIFSMTSSQLLSQIAKGEIDCKELAMRVLEDRGLNIEGQWVGFDTTIGQLLPLVVIKQGLESNATELSKSDRAVIAAIIALIEDGMAISAKKMAAKSSETVQFYTLVS